ncbi:MAG: Uma2 family endonuclease [Synechococcales cyanobacterium RM1_1_8]|nr:Uma2 family endonuclease [Synechococcales cyanobacterium RM1_1_8]
MIIASTTPMTLEEYLSYDDGTDHRYELIDGVLVQMGAESEINLQIAGFLLSYFLGFGIPHYLLTNKTEMVVRSRLAKTRYPDLMIKTEALDAAMPRSERSIVLPGMPAPQLVVEVVSPGQPGDENYDRDYVEKRREYAQRGIPEYWIVDPSRGVVLVLALEEMAYQEVGTFRGAEGVRSPTFPQLSLTAEQVLGAGR